MPDAFAHRPKSEACRTLRAIAAASIDDPDAIIRPREVVELFYAPGLRPSLACRRLMLLLMAEAGVAAADDVTHRIERRRLPAGHRNFDDFQKLVLEIRAVSLVKTCNSGRGRRAILTVGVFHWVKQEVDPTGTAWIEWRFTPEARHWIRESSVYARISRRVLRRLRSAYTLELYQWAALLAGREHPRWSGSIEDLRALLGAGQLCWRDLRRDALEVAAKELQPAGIILEFRITRRRGREVQAVCLVFRAVAVRAHREAKTRRMTSPQSSVQRAIAMLQRMDHYPRDAWRQKAIERGAPADSMAAPTESALSKWAEWIAHDVCAQFPTTTEK